MGEEILVAWHDNGVAIADLQELSNFVYAIILEKKLIDRQVYWRFANITH